MKITTKSPCLLMPETIQEWAKRTTQEMIDTIKWHIDNGMNQEQALKMVLNESVVGAGYKAQIEYEIKSYNNQ